MGEILFDFGLLAGLIVGITAFFGVISSAIGINIFGRGKQNVNFDQTNKTQVGWKHVGGSRTRKKLS